MTEQVDMAQFVEAKSDQLNADDLIGTSPESGRTITITAVRGCEGDQPIAINYKGDGGKPFKPCKTIRRVLLAIWGRNASEYVGRSMTIYRDDAVMFGGLNVGGIRISHMSHLDKETVVVVMKSKGKKAGIKVLPLKVEQPTKTDAGLDAVLATLKAVAKPGQMDALGAAWKEIGAGARKALAAELPTLKAACELPADDVPFDAETGEITEPADNERQVEPDTNVNDVAEAAAAKIIAEIEAPECNAEMDVKAVLSRREADIAALPDDQQMRVEIAVSRRRAAIEKAKAGSAVEEAEAA